MKINPSSTASNTTMSSSQDTSGFQIAANGTAFQILSSGLYSNKIAAVIRELSCNAVDAHAMVNDNNKPIKVQLPTAKDPVLQISDEGPGLSHEQILSLYTTYFSSNKRESNNFIGGLGLGSKSPFAYTKVFTVASTQNGLKRVYACALSDDGSPTITKTAEVKTTRANGIDVSMPVQQKDIGMFEQEAAKVFSWFRVRPQVNIFLNYQDEQKMVVTPSFTLMDKHFSLGRWESFQGLVQMGDVTYPIDFMQLNQQAGHEHFQTMLNTFPMVVKSPIGFLSVAASREALQYDPQTRKNMVQLFTQAMSDFIRAWHDTGKNESTMWAKRVAYYQFWTKYSRGYFNSGFSETLNFFAKQYVDILAVVEQQKTAKLHAAGTLPNVNVGYYELHKTTKKQVDQGRFSVGKHKHDLRLPYTEGAILVVDSVQVNERVKSWRDLNPKAWVLLVSGSTKKDEAAALEHALVLSKAIGDAPVIKTSTIDVNVQAKDKKDYVPIEDRLVKYYDFSTGAESDRRLGDLQPQERFMLVRDTTARDPQFFMENPVADQKTLVMTMYEWHQIQSGVSKLCNAGHLLKSIKGFVQVRPVDVDRLKLVDRGFQHISKALPEAMLGKEATVYAVWRESWPEASKSTYSHYGLNVYPWMEELCTIYKDTHSHLNQWLTTVLSNNDMIGLVKSRIIAMSHHRDIYIGYVALHRIAERYGISLKTPHCTKDTFIEYNEKYPNVEFLSPELLVERLYNLKQDSDEAASLRAGLELMLAKKS